MQQLLDFNFNNFQTLLYPATCAIAGLYVIKRVYTQFTLPPGPIGYPIVGRYTKFTQQHFHLECDEIVKKYGPLSSVYIGQTLVVLVSDFDMLKDMLSLPVYSARHTNPIQIRTTRNCGIVLTHGDSWSTQRRFSLQVLRDFGFAKSLSVEMIQVEADRLVKKFDEFCVDPNGVKVLDVFTEAANNTIASITYGNDPDEEDKDFEKVVKSIKEYTSSGGLVNAGFAFPIIGRQTWLIKRFPVVQRIIDNLNVMYAYAEKKIKERRQILKDNATPECLCDSYILEQQKAELKGDFETFKDFQIVRVCTELFGAGTDTTAKSLEWLMVYMAVYDSVQEKVYQEIVECLGEEGRVQMADRSRLNYTLAVMDETYRRASLAAISLPHRSLEDTYYRGYFIPKDTVILPLIYSVHHSSKYFEKPQDFKPEHFLDDKGHYKPSPYLIPFSVGKRVCLGESLARMELFLIFVSLMQKFKVKLHEDFVGREKDVLVGKMGIVVGCENYKLVISRR